MPADLLLRLRFTSVPEYQAARVAELVPSGESGWQGAPWAGPGCIIPAGADGSRTLSLSCGCLAANVVTRSAGPGASDHCRSRPFHRRSAGDRTMALINYDQVERP